MLISFDIHMTYTLYTVCRVSGDTMRGARKGNLLEIFQVLVHNGVLPNHCNWGYLSTVHLRVSFSSNVCGGSLAKRGLSVIMKVRLIICSFSETWISGYLCLGSPVEWSQSPQVSFKKRRKLQSCEVRYLDQAKQACDACGIWQPQGQMGRLKWMWSGFIWWLKFKKNNDSRGNKIFEVLGVSYIQIGPMGLLFRDGHIGPRSC